MLSQLFSLRNLVRSCYECVPHKQIASILCEPILVSDSLLFSRAFALGRRIESEVRVDRNDGGGNRAGAARAFEDAVVACDRLTRTVGAGSVKRVAEEVVEWVDLVPEPAQHLRVLVHCVSLEPSQYRECYRARRRRRGETEFCAWGQIREDTRG